MIYETGEWKSAKENWDSYDMTEIVEVPLKEDIAASYKAGFKFVVITANAVHGHGTAPEETWASARRAARRRSDGGRVLRC